MVKNLPTMQETWCSIPWRRKWQPIPVFLPGKSHGQRSLEGCSPWGHKKSDMIEWLTHTNDLFTLFPLLPHLWSIKESASRPRQYGYIEALACHLLRELAFLTSALCPLDLLAYREGEQSELGLGNNLAWVKDGDPDCRGFGRFGWGKALVWVLMKSEGF